MSGSATSTENKALLLDLVEWVAESPRLYAEVMDAWRTSCPRLPIWEDAVDLGFLVRKAGPAGCAMVDVTAAGRAFLQGERSARLDLSATPATNLT